MGTVPAEITDQHWLPVPADPLVVPVALLAATTRRATPVALEAAVGSMVPVPVQVALGLP